MLPFLLLLDLCEPHDLPIHHLGRIHKNKRKLIDLAKLFQNLVVLFHYACGFQVNHSENQTFDDKFEAKPAGSRTQKDVDEFNKAVSDINAGVNTYNNTNNELNKKRSANLDGWNNVVKRYMDTYIPQQKK